MAEGDFLCAVSERIPLMTLGPTAIWSFSHSSPGESQEEATISYRTIHIVMIGWISYFFSVLF